MPLFGAHMSSAGGLHNAIVEAEKHSCEAVQLFTKAPSQWRAPAITAEAAAQFHTVRSETGIQATMVHDAYLINLASPDDAIRQKSISAFADEVERAEQIGADFLVMHPGAHMGIGEEEGCARVVEAMNQVISRTDTRRVRILVETTAGQGTTLGHRFEHIATILAGIDAPERFGVCFDTCHVFAAGYPLSPRRAYLKTWREFDRLIGIERLFAFHLNDSAKPMGSRVDRHAHIGLGELGIEPFAFIVRDRRFRKLPMVLETPKGAHPKDGDWDHVNLATLRRLADGE